MAKVLQKQVVTSTHPTSLVAGQTYHFHVPAGTDCSGWLSGSTQIEIYCSNITNIITTISKSTREAGGRALAIGHCPGTIEDWAGVSYDGTTGYDMRPATADFDCDFVYHSYAGALSEILPFITEMKTVVLTKDSKVLVK